MAIDLIFLLLMILAAYKGGKRGAIVAIFSLIAMIIGLAAAMKLSQLVASWLGSNVSMNAKWLPVIAFILIVVVVFLCIQLLAKILEKAVETIWLGPLNHLCGAVIYMVLMTLLMSVILFYVVQFKPIDKSSAIHTSKVYPYIQSWGPWVINGLGKWIPIFKDLFTDLQAFFGNMSGKITN